MSCFQFLGGKVRLVAYQNVDDTRAMKKLMDGSKTRACLENSHPGRRAPWSTTMVVQLLFSEIPDSVLHKPLFTTRCGIKSSAVKMIHAELDKPVWHPPIDLSHWKQPTVPDGVPVHFATASLCQVVLTRPGIQRGRSGAEIPTEIRRKKTQKRSAAC